MLRNYFIIATRHLAKNKFFTLINIFCLALGMSLSLLFITMVAFIYTYDDFHANKDQIYRIITQVHDKIENPEFATAPVDLISKLKEEVSGIERVIPVQSALRGNASYLNKELYTYGYFVDPEFLQTFSFPLIKGNAASALTRPNTIVISETLATKFFGSKEPMGEIIKIEPYGGYVVTGIMKDIPKNSHMHFEALASYETLTLKAGAFFSDGDEKWEKFESSYIYVLLPKTTKPATIENYLNSIAKDKFIHHKDFPTSFELQPLTDIIPGRELLNTIGPRWSYFGLFLIGLLTSIILIPACSNYITLSIAQSLNRMKEIGVRKVMGGSKKQIFFQFITETTIMMLLASVLSFFIFQIIRNEALSIMESESIMDLTPNFQTVIYYILFALFVGFAAGVIPALYFSKISPVVALKAKPPKTGKSSFPLQKIIIATQFVLSIGFIMGVVVIFQQYRYNVKYDLGFEQENILTIDIQNVAPQLVKSEYSKLSAVKGVSMSSHLLGTGDTYAAYFKKAEGSDSIGAYYVSIDENFIPNLKLTLLAGENFDSNAAKDKSNIIINEEFIKELNISEPFKAIGKSVLFSDGKEAIISGVIKNFHYTDLREPIGKFFFKHDPDQFEYANVQVTSRDAFKDLSGMEAIWKSIAGSDEFRAQFYSDQISDAYGDYVQIMKLWGFLGLLAITVACLGLLGTVVFTIKNRLKEVSIRKVLGASSQSLVILLSKDYIKLMAIASLIAIPATYLLLDKAMLSLQHYRIEIGFVEVLVSLLIVVVIGLTTILSQTLKAAQANPVDNLKSE